MAHLAQTMLAMVLATWLAQSSAQQIVSVVATPSSPQVGVAITKLQITFEDDNSTSHSFSSGEKIIIKVTGGENVFIAGATPSVSLTYDGSATDQTVKMTDGKTLEISGGTNDTQAGGSYVLTIMSGFVAPQTQGTNVAFSVVFPSGATASQGGSPAWVVGVSPAFSDPITFYNGTKTKFWIPNGVYTTLLATPDLRVLAKPLVGPGDLQWFESMRVLRKGEETLADVGVARGESPPSADRGFVGEQVAVNFSRSMHNVGHTREMAFVTADMQIQSVVLTKPSHIARTHGKHELEHVCMESPSVTFCIHASHAGNEFPNDIEMQKKYVHLDFTLTSSLLPLSAFTGVLPELWGEIPMSEGVRAMLKPPSPAGPGDSPTVCTAQ